MMKHGRGRGGMAAGLLLLALGLHADDGGIHEARPNSTVRSKVVRPPQTDPADETWWPKTEAVIAAVWTAVRPYAEPAAWAIAWPVRKIGIEPSGWGLTVAAVFSWWCWGTALRLLLWTIPGRICGYYDLKYARRWLLIFSPPWRRPYSWVVPRLKGWWGQLRYKGVNRRWMGFIRKMTFVFISGKTILVGVLSHHRIKFFQPVGLPDMQKGGICITAAVGSGKSVHLQAMGGSMAPQAAAVFVDCDAGMVRSIGPGLKRDSHPLFKFDPDRIDDTIPCCVINLMSELERCEKRHGPQFLPAFASIMGQACIVPDSKTQPVFCDTARVFFIGVVLYVHKYEKPTNRDLPRVRALITGGLPEMANPDEHPVDALLRVMRSKRGDANDGCGGLIGKAIAEAADVMPAAEKEGNASFWSTLRYQTAWMSDAALVPHITGPSDICGEDLKLTNAVVFLVGALSDIKGRLAPLVRAYMAMTMYAFQRIPGERVVSGKRIPATLFLDECGNLGRLEILPTALTGFRKYGLRVVAVFQSLQQAQAVYPNEWREFYGQAQATIWMGIEDPGTLKYLSEETLGKTMRKEKIEGTAWWKFWGKRIPSRYQLRETWLLDQNACADVLNPATEQIIVKPFGLPPMILRRAKHHVELPVWKHERDRTHRENRLKSLFRARCERRRAKSEEREAVRAWVSARKAPQAPKPVAEPVMQAEPETVEPEPPAAPVAAAPLEPSEPEAFEPERPAPPGMTRTQAVFEELLHPEEGVISPALRARAYDAFAADIAKGMSAGDLCENIMKRKDFTMAERRKLLKAFMDALAGTRGYMRALRESG